jgi:hypothetical protein
MRDIIFAFMRDVTATDVLGRGFYRFDQPLIGLPYGANTKYATNATFIATLWELVAEGIIVPGDATSLREGSGNNETWPYFTITPHGYEVLTGSGTTTSPHDVTRYLAEAKQRLPNGDDAIALYLAEATRAFTAELYLSSVIMLGVSAEALMEWLIECMRKHLANRPTDLTKFNNDLQKTEFKTAARFDRLFNEVWAHAGDLKRDLRSMVEAQLSTVMTLLKTYRDDVAHRRPFRVDGQLADGQLKIYLATLSVSAELADALAKPCTLP